MSTLTLVLDCHDELPGIDPSDWQLLSADERHKANRFVFDRDRQQSIRAAAGLRRALAAYCGLPPETLVFQRNAYGKPCLVPGPASASTAVPQPTTNSVQLSHCEFNLSHSSGAILIGIARHPLGVDVEHFAGRPFPESVMSSVFTDREREMVCSDRLGLQISGFMHWSRKEAVIKADGRGMSLNPAGFDIRVEPLPAQSAELARDCWRCDIDGQSYFGATVALRKGWVCAIACRNQADRDRALWLWDRW
ncbi:hypothetical protein C7S18_07950 [Ahniella affigens]|uniref:Uncharacterized protein n=1 Tax=Ahniella affigens TaxID=2021234 RepID=A0A2P1PQP5_9GAMM|nr:4'-phosphopantetheinyl transferase superfamily protein [Ahniella affigens]AVP97128.1 hypothetical protein C7S18_07950 [Ahniella affigens]